ncbi:unnamed protein product [Amoebophrya sp. A120]|nr:unnamed protein product [Amoebophrya sp. A120]|eukprot:GSA120T00004876001.1
MADRIQVDYNLTEYEVVVMTRTFSLTGNVFFLNNFLYSPDRSFLQAFKFFDVDRSGDVDVTTEWASRGCPLDTDRNGDGRVDDNEFQQFCSVPDALPSSSSSAGGALFAGASSTLETEPREDTRVVDTAHDYLQWRFRDKNFAADRQGELQPEKLNRIRERAKVLYEEGAQRRAVEEDSGWKITSEDRRQKIFDAMDQARTLDTLDDVARMNEMNGGEEQLTTFSNFGSAPEEKKGNEKGWISRCLGRCFERRRNDEEPLLP